MAEICPQNLKSALQALFLPSSPQILCMFECWGWVGVWMGVGCPCPPSASLVLLLFLLLFSCGHATIGCRRSIRRCDPVKKWRNERFGYYLCMFVYEVGFGVWMGVGCPCPPIRNNIVIPRRLFSITMSLQMDISP